MIYLWIKNPVRIVFCHNPEMLLDIFILHNKWISRYIFSLLAPICGIAVNGRIVDYTDNEIEVLDKLYSIDTLSPSIGEYLKSCNETANIKIAPCSFSDYSKINMKKHRDIDLLMVARFTESKGYELLEQISEIADRYRLVISGFGHLAPNVPRAEILSMIDPSELFSRAKVFLSIQTLNNYPSQSLLEAMASGCAVIATDVGETRMLMDESNSILIQYDALDLTNAIELLMRRPNLIERLGKNGREKVLKEHTIEKYANYFRKEIIDL